MWFKLPRVLDGDLYQRGRLFDCGDMLSASVNGTSLRVNLTQNITFSNGTVSTLVLRQVLDTP
jgi:hypothetical protein